MSVSVCVVCVYVFVRGGIDKYLFSINITKSCRARHPWKSAVEILLRREIAYRAYFHLYPIWTLNF